MRAPRRVLIADDHAGYRALLVRLIEREPDLEVVAAVRDGLSAVREIARLRPDVALVDLRMPDLGGLDVLDRLRLRRIATPVVIASGDDHRELVGIAARKGAVGFISKTCDLRTLTATLRAAAP